MIDRLIRVSLQHRPVVLALAVAFLLWGGWTATRIPLDVLPDLTAPTVTILTEAPGMDPLEIESLVTFPIESALNGAAGVRRVRSATADCERKALGCSGQVLLRSAVGVMEVTPRA